MRVICVVSENHELLMPHFIKYYKRLEVEGFEFGVKGGKSNPAWDYLTALGEPQISLHEVPTKEHSINGIVDAEFINRTKAAINKWYIPADMDEFHGLRTLPFPKILEMCNEAGLKQVRSVMVDRMNAEGGISPTIDPEVDIFDQFPMERNMTKEIAKGCVEKVMLAHPSVDVGAGHHYAKIGWAECLPEVGTTYHFKWFGNVLDRELAKLEARRSNKSPWAAENERTLRYFGQTT